LERCANANRRSLTILEKLSLAGIIVWGLHNLNVLALRIWCALEFEYRHFFSYEVFNWAVAKALDYSIMFFKSKELQREPVLQVKNARFLQRFFLLCATIIFILDCISIVHNFGRSGILITGDCVLVYGNFTPSEDQLSIIITMIYTFFEPSATVTGLYLFVKPFFKFRKSLRTVVVAREAPQSNVAAGPSDPRSSSEHLRSNAATSLEQGENVQDLSIGHTISNVEQKENEEEPHIFGTPQQTNKLNTALKWNCIGVCLSQLSVWLVNIQFLTATDLLSWLRIHYWIHGFDAYFHILCIHMVFLDFQTVPDLFKSVTNIFK